MVTRKMGTVVLVSVCAVLLAGCDWSMYGYGPAHTHYNPVESKVGVDNVATLTTKWSATTADRVESSPAVVNGVVYVGSNDGNLYAFDAVTGAHRWTATPGGLVASSPAVVNGVVFVGSDDGNLYAFDALTGARRWTAPTGGGVESAPTVANGVVYVGSFDGKLYAFDAAGNTGCSGTPKTCAPLWTATTGSLVEWSPAVANGVVFVASDDGKLYAFDAAGTTSCSGTPKTCAPLWTATTGTFGGSTPVVANGLVYVGGSDGRLYAFDSAGTTSCSGTPKTCAPIWTATVGAGIGSEPAVANGVAYVGSFDGRLYAFDAAGSIGCSGSPRTCDPLWSAPTAEAVASAPAVANGVVYVGSWDNRLYAFDAAGSRGCSGVPTVCASLWTATTGAFVSSSPAVVNGVVYVGSDDGKLYAFGLPKIHVVERSSHFVDTLMPGESGSISTLCHDDEVAVGGGFIAANAGDASSVPAVSIDQNEATPDGATNPTEWTVSMTNIGPDYTYFTTRAVCASAGSTTLHVVERANPGLTLTPGTSGSSTATCQSGEVAVGGGSLALRTGDGSIAHAVTVGQSEATPEGATNPAAWTAFATNNDTVNVDFGARVMCASAGSTALHVVERLHAGAALAPGATGSATAVCHVGEVATGGGFVARRSSDGSIDPAVTARHDEATPDGAVGPTAWTAIMTNNDAVKVNFGARILCLS